LLSCSPPLAICQLAEHWAGAFIGGDLVMTALPYIAREIVEGENQPKGLLCDQAGNIVATSFQNDDKALKEGKDIFNCEIKNLIELSYPKADTKLSSQRKRTLTKTSAIMTGFIVAGAMKRVVELIKIQSNRKQNIQLILNTALSLIGIAGPGIGNAAGVIAVLSDAVFDRLYLNKCVELQAAVQDFITECIYWPLIDDQILPFVSNISPEHLDSDSIILFKLYFELVMRSNHF